MHSDNDPRVVLCLDGLAMSFLMLDGIYSGLYPSCLKLPTDNASTAAAFLRCWSFVDVAHRIREVAQAAPGLSGKNVELLKFLRETTIVEKFRNYVQHLRGELSRKTPNTFPVWGSLSWMDANDEHLCHISHAGAQIGTVHHYGLIYDRLERKWVSKVALNVDELSLNFDLIYDFYKQFQGFIVPWLLAKYAPGIEVRPDLPITSIRMVLTPE